MRLRRLDLTRYGHFSGKTIDFGPRRAGTPDLHLVYGDNEAGKSTALQAWLDLLFGIPAQSDHAFLHPYASMRIGAAVEIGDQVLELVRVKGNRATLLGPGDQQVPDALLLSGLGGLDRAGVRAMFSLDDETLEAGGNSILASEGEVGQMLFASGAGLAGFSARLDALRKEADQFHKLGARSGLLSDLKDRLGSLEAERKRLDTDAGLHKQLAEARDHAEAVWRNAQQAQEAVAAQLRGVERQLAALPFLANLQAAEARIAELPDLPPPPDGWVEELAGLEKALAAADAQGQTLAATMDELAAEQGNLVPDPAILALKGRIDAAERLRSAHDEAVKDLPARREEAGELALRIAGHLARLGRTGEAAAAVLPEGAVIADLRDLIEARSGIDAGLTSARSELLAAQEARSQAESQLSAAGADPAGGDISTLEAVLRSLRSEPPAAAERQTAMALEEATADWHLRLRGLAPWQGDHRALAALVLPGHNCIVGWKRALADAASAQALAVSDLQRIAQDITAQAMPPPPGNVTLAAAALARATREAAWAGHLSALDKGTALVFEAAMRHDDVIAGQLAEALAGGRMLVEAEARRAAAVRAEDQANAARDGAVQAQADTADAIAASLAQAGLPPMSVAALEEWLARRALALDAGDRQLAATRAHGRALALVGTARETLVAALALAGVDAGPHSLQLLIAKAEALCDGARALAVLREARAGAVAQLALRQTTWAAAEKTDAGWQAAWAVALARAGIAPGKTVPALRDDLQTLALLQTDAADAAALASRIAKMEANVAAFAPAVSRMATDTGIAADEPQALWQALTGRLQRAEATGVRLAELASRLDRARAEALRQAALRAQSGTRIAEMALAFGATGAAALRQQLGFARDRVTAQSEIAGTGEAMRQSLGAATVGAARLMLSEVQADALSALQQRLSGEVRMRGDEAQRAFADLSDAQTRLLAVGGDDAVARLVAERETVLLEITEAAQAHLALRLGLIAVEHGLARYRESHRSAMIGRASDAFRTITRGAYSGLATQPASGKEVLVALAAAGGSKRADALSKGTRFQLYLALRVAAYHELAARMPPPPFVADDIMETFDDDRAAEAFQLLAGMAGAGQVIYLTHHRHLCDIARQVCPAAQVHLLG